MDDTSSSGRGSMSQRSAARPDGYFDQVHKCIDRQIQKGNGDAVLLLLSLPELHEDALFWRTCKSHAGIASAVLSNYLAVTGETQGDGGNCRVPMSRNELYALLKRCGDDKSACSAVVTAMEEGQPVTVDLANLCSLLQARAVPVKRDRDGNSASLSSQGGPSPGDNNKKNVSSLYKDEERRLLEGLARSALPGSVAMADSFDDLGQFTAPRLGRVSDETTAAVQQPQPAAPSRLKQQFSKEEDEAIVKGIGKFPVGPSRFTEIFREHKQVWKEGRTAQQLADHWRSVLKDKTILGGAN